MPVGRPRTSARAFKRQTGRFLHDDQHKRPVCHPFADGDKNPAANKAAGAQTRAGADAVTLGGTANGNNERRVMKKKILMLIAFSIVVTALVGCQQKTDNSMPTSTNGVTDQGATGAAGGGIANTNSSPMPTNPPTPGAGNQ
jgi:hypothetical protein